MPDAQDPDHDEDDDGVPDPRDPDDDNDGILDSNDEDHDNDGDGVNDKDDPDDDNDGIPDDQDTDDDGDGIPDAQDPDHDEDGDGVCDPVDPDDDNDGIPDSMDPDHDNDGDGIDDTADDDDDNDGIPDDQDDDDDGDGTPDEDDDDSDGGGGGGGTPPTCRPTLRLLHAGFRTGTLYAWPPPASGMPTQLAPPDDGTNWQWTLGAGGTLPVVVGFGEKIKGYIELRVTLSAGCSGALHLRMTDGIVTLGQAVIDPDDLPAPGTSEDIPVEFDEDELPVWNNVILKGPGWVTYDYSVDGGASWHRFAVAGPKVWYVMHRREGLLGAVPRYDLALDKVAAYATGQGSESTIAEQLNEGIAADIYYDPGDDGVIPDQDQILTVYERKIALCKFNAQLLEHLAHAAGIGANVQYYWGGALGTRADFYQHAIPDNWVSFRAVCPAEDAVSENPHFLYHAQTIINAEVYDPSYGTTGLVVFSEMSPSYSEAHGIAYYPPVPGYTLRTPVQQQGSQWPPTGSPWYILVPYRCSCPIN